MKHIVLFVGLISLGSALCAEAQTFDDALSGNSDVPAAVGPDIQSSSRIQRKPQKQAPLQFELPGYQVQMQSIQPGAPGAAPSSNPQAAGDPSPNTAPSQ